jgi:hypothetical protein
MGSPQSWQELQLLKRTTRGCNTLIDIVGAARMEQKRVVILPLFAMACSFEIV